MREFSKLQKLCSLILKIVVIVSAILGTFLSWYAGRGSFMGGSRVFMYFTIQSNIAIALICLYGLYLVLKEKEINNSWYVFKFVGSISITLTGMVFCFVLAPTLGKYAWNFQNVLTHVVVPIAAVVDFFVVAVNGDIQKKHDWLVILPPIAYAIYAGIGYVCNWQFSDGINYPYFFLNWGSPAGAFGFCEGLPFMGCGWWILMLFVLLLAVGYLYLLLVDVLKKVVK